MRVILSILSLFALVLVAMSQTTERYLVTFKDTASFKDIQNHVVEHRLSALSDNEHPYWTTSNSVLEMPEVQWLPESDGTPLIWYTGEFTDEMLEAARNDPFVDGVYKDETFSISPIVDSDSIATEKNWGLDRVSNRGRMSAVKNKSILKTDGNGVRVYVLDTGIETTHPEFESRAKFGASFIKTDPNDSDHNGHSTHVASSVGGKTFGVSPSATLVSVKVLNGAGSGSLSGIMSGLEWVAKDHKLRKNAKSVANLSLGAGRNELLNRAVNALVDAGVHVVVAAGNENNDACRTSPSSAEKVVTVGASTIEDKRAFFSNYGDCVSIYAAGHQITGAWLKGTTRTISGTSMASPHVAGVVAALLSRTNATVSPADMKKGLISGATMGVLSGDLVKPTQGLAFTCPRSTSSWQCPREKVKAKKFAFQDYLWNTFGDYEHQLYW